MKEVLIFAGTTEGRKLSEYLIEECIPHTICVATEYGEIVLEENPLVTVHQGRMQEQEIRDFIKKKDYMAVIDATHPYAAVITHNIQSAMKELTVPYYRLQRDYADAQAYEKCFYFENHEECALALEEIAGNILLTTGSKELALYAKKESVKNRLFVRVLPSVESITLCMEKGIVGKQILAMQGPFCAELNEALIRQYKIACLVTKESGANGGYAEKVEAAKRADIPVYVIQNAAKKEGFCFEQVCREIDALYRKSNRVLQKTKEAKGFEIVLAGTGMGDEGNLTKEVYEEISQADFLLGADRMIQKYGAHIEKKPFYQASKIIPYLEKQQEKYADTGMKKVVILFSGDSGFYSGCTSLYQSLEKEIKQGALSAVLRILPGISSISYLASCVGVSYQDAAIRSIHGKSEWEQEILIAMKHHAKTFLLTSGAKDIRALGEILLENGLETCMVIAGYQLSYSRQQIITLTAEECCHFCKEGLYTCLIQNPSASLRRLTHGIADEDFIRDKIPMTKEEVREISICKLKLYEKAVLYDIGSGTGSIAVEAASLSETVQVYALERKQEAVSLLESNCQKFGVRNISVIHTLVPEGLERLPMPTHAFIGGSSGRLAEIMEVLYQKNPRLRVVINAISMETICEIRELLEKYKHKVRDVDVVQVQTSKAKKAGDYHMMQAQNPVWICSFTFQEEEI